MQKIVISVIGASKSTPEMDQLAYEIGKFIAEMECILVCGGLQGVMEASCKGSKEAGGETIGILPGLDKADANPYVDVALPSTIGFARNTMVVASGDIIVALPGSHGTRSEISYALVYKRPVIDLGNWKIEGMIEVNGVEEAKVKIKELVNEIKT